MNTSSPQVIDQIVSKMSKEDCLKVLNDPRVSLPALQSALAAVASTPFVSAAPAMAASPAAMAAATNGAAAAKAPKAPKAAPAGGAKSDAGKAMVAIKTFTEAGMGFSAGDIATALQCDARDSSIRTALKNALGAGVIFQAGEKRFSRYGGTAEIASAASLKAAGK